MKLAATIKFFGIFFIGLIASLPAVSAAPGGLDPTFNGTGRVLTPMAGASAFARAVAIQPDGKIVAGGRVGSGNDTDFVLTRYHRNGSLDASFGGDGIVTTDFYGGFPFYADFLGAIAIQPDGKIVAAGYTFAGGPRGFAVARYNADGSLDSTFGSGGKVITYLNAQNLTVAVNAVAVQPDGKIIAAGSIAVSDQNTNYTFALIRYHPDGSLDASFDGDGKLTAAIAGTHSSVQALAIQPDGKILAAGHALVAGGTYDFALVRCHPDGSFDASFDGDGVALTDFNGFYDGVLGVALQPDGKIVAAGEAGTGTGFIFSVARYHPDGSLDASFDGDGKTTTAVGGTANDRANAAIVQPDGKIVAAGSFRTNQGDTDFALVRYRSNGTLDSAYGLGGKVAFGDPNGFDAIYGLALDSSGRAVAAGIAFQNFAVARFLGDAAPVASAPFDFDGDGKTDVSVFRPRGTGPAEWWYGRSLDGQVAALQFGASGDAPVPADYTGDGKTDIAFYRPATSEWFILRSEDNSFYAFPFGTAGDVPAAGDFDGDGRSDPAVFRPSTATWFVQRSTAGTLIAAFGASDDRPVVGDYDGDGRADLAVFRRNGSSGNAEWWYVGSANGQTIALPFGLASDRPVVGDYTGDGRTDIGFFRAATGEWHILRSEDNSFYAFPFGTAGDLPVPGDYDGDGRWDAAVFRPSAANWFVQRSTAGTLIATFGASGDRPLPGVFVP